MNGKMIRFIIGRMLGVEAVVLLFPMIVSLIYKEESYIYFLMTSILLFIIFFIAGRKKPEDNVMYAKEGLVIVALAWILWSLSGALPFFLSGSIPNYINALFETVSGFTTTGSTILTDVEGLSKGMHFWRCLTHWIGGMGVLVFVMVLTSLDNKSSMYLMRAEVPGPEADKILPKARSTAKFLYGMYFILTLIELFFLLMGGMSLYDGILCSFSTAGTGGFFNYADSIGHFNSPYLEGVISTFMVLFGINFNLYYLVCIVEWKSLLKNEELRVFLGVIASATLAITLNITGIYGSVVNAFRYAVFQVTTIISTTGFATANYEVWPELSKMILLTVMVIGACAGSTGGGIKVSRLIIMVKSIARTMKGFTHPKSVNIVRLNGKKVSDKTVQGVYTYLLAYILIFVTSCLLIAIDNFDFATTVSSVVTTLNNVGPGLAKIGPVESFHAFSPFSKIVFCFTMLIGRLEIFPFLMLISPSLWHKKF